MTVFVKICFCDVTTTSCFAFDVASTKEVVTLAVVDDSPAVVAVSAVDTV